MTTERSVVAADHGEISLVGVEGALGARHREAFAIDPGERVVTLDLLGAEAGDAIHVVGLGDRAALSEPGPATHETVEHAIVHVHGHNFISLLTSEPFQKRDQAVMLYYLIAPLDTTILSMYFWEHHKHSTQSIVL